MEEVVLKLRLTAGQTADLTRLVQRLSRRPLDGRDLDLVSDEEARGAEAAVLELREALARATDGMRRSG